MAKRTPNNKRKQRERKWIDEQLGDDTGKSDGQFWVLDMQTGEKTPSLNQKQAKELWASLKRACYFSMDTYTPGVAPLRAVYVKGPLPG